MRIRDWSSDVCSSDLGHRGAEQPAAQDPGRVEAAGRRARITRRQLGHEREGAAMGDLRTDRCTFAMHGVGQRAQMRHAFAIQIGRANVTPVTKAHLVCRLLLEKKNKRNSNTNTKQKKEEKKKKNT